ncbi:MAG: hypothetical protein LBR20_02490 [Propionibacteriaceae bacterium]|nr:hypothetical protein [Propionibacteriaceae bacterium]
MLEDADAPSEVEFHIDLPESSVLIPQHDGSIAVMAEISVSTVSEEEAERFVEQVDSILGSDYDGTTSLSSEQDAIISRIPAPTTETTTQSQQIAVINAPWAIDAEGNPLDTYYEIDDDGITQVIETDENTHYPVTADPWWDWLPRAIQLVYAGAKTITVISNYNFAVRLGNWILATTLATGGTCRYEKSWPIWVCWGGRLTMLDGYGGGTTYGTTYYASKDPKSGRTSKQPT